MRSYKTVFTHLASLASWNQEMLADSRVRKTRLKPRGVRTSGSVLTILESFADILSMRLEKIPIQFAVTARFGCK